MPQPTQLATLVRAQLVVVAAAPGTLIASPGDVDPTAQGLVIDTKLTAYLTQRPARRRADQRDRVSTELLGILRWTGHQNILPQTNCLVSGCPAQWGNLSVQISAAVDIGQIVRLVQMLSGQACRNTETRKHRIDKCSHIT